MKKVVLLTSLFCFFLSCTTEEPIVIEESDFYGEWNLISAEADREIDYNFDGDTATDILEDLDCFTIQLKIDPDNTFREVIYDRPGIDDEVICSISLHTGTWEYLKESNQIAFNYLDENGQLLHNVRSEFTVDKNRRLQFFREFLDNSGNFKAELHFVYLN